MTTMTLRLLAVALLFSVPQAALAQSPPGQAAPAAATTPSGQLLKPEQLDALVAPIALYPDTLLAEVFMASTYPLEIVQAARWAEANKNLKDDELKGAVDKQKWDNSVKALVATPSVLEMMSSKLDWTQQLGDAILAQQPDVMDAVQRLRAKAQANNKLDLQSTADRFDTTAGRPTDYRHPPTEPDEIYVPYYDPGVVYGAWPYPDYLPYSWPAPGYIAAGVIATGIAFGAGYALGRWATGGYRWGGGFDWGGRNINVNRSINVNNVRVQQLVSQSRTPAGRALQQRERGTKIWWESQRRRVGRTHRFPRQKRPASAASGGRQPGECRRRCCKSPEYGRQPGQCRSQSPEPRKPNNSCGPARW